MITLRRSFSLALAAALVGGILAPTPATSLVTTAGKQAAIARLIDATSTPAIFNYIGVGTGDGSGSCTAAAPGDTTLQTETGTRQQDTDATPDPPSPTGQQQLIVTFAAGNATGALCEVGLFNASSSGTMLTHSTFSVVNKGAGDSLQVTITLTQS